MESDIPPYIYIIYIYIIVSTIYRYIVVYISIYSTMAYNAFFRIFPLTSALG